MSMSGEIKTTKAIYMVHGVEHFTQEANIVEFTGRKTWRSLQMALKRGGFDFATVCHENSVHGEYAMAYSNYDRGRIAPTKQIEVSYFWQ